MRNLEFQIRVFIKKLKEYLLLAVKLMIKTIKNCFTKIV